jgi:hypothetical protein
MTDKVFEGTPKEFAKDILGLDVKVGRGRMPADVKAKVDQAIADGWVIKGGAVKKAVTQSDETVTPKDVVSVPRNVVTTDKFDPQTVREWANANGFEVGRRGRIREEVYAAYAEGNPEAKPAAPKPASNAILAEAPRIYPSGTRFQVTGDGVNKKVFVSSKAACANGGVSLSHCDPARHPGKSHSAVAQGFVDLVTVVPVPSN